MSERIISGAGRRAMRRILSSKSAPRDYYKGTGTGPMGEHTKHGKYSVDPEKIRQFIVPNDLINFSLKPYVSHKTPKIKEHQLTVDSFFQVENTGEPLSPPKQVLDRPPIRVPNIAKRVAEELLEKLTRKNRIVPGIAIESSSTGNNKS